MVIATNFTSIYCVYKEKITHTEERRTHTNPRAEYHYFPTRPQVIKLNLKLIVQILFQALNFEFNSRHWPVGVSALRLGISFGNTPLKASSLGSFLNPFVVIVSMYNYYVNCYLIFFCKLLNLTNSLGKIILHFEPY